MLLSGKAVGLGLLVLAFASVLMIMGGCAEAPIGSSSKAPADYVVYFHSMVGNRMIYLYRPYTQQLDSASLQFDIQGYDFFKGVTLSADGSLLYMPFEDTIVVFDSDSLTVVDELPYDASSLVSVSPADNYIAFTSEGLYVLNSADHTVAYRDTLAVTAPVFSDDGLHLYGYVESASPPFDRYIYALDLSVSPPDVQLYPAPGRIRQILPSADDSIFYLYGQAGSFGIYDPAGDTMLFSHTMTGRNGYMARTNDDRLVFYGSPPSVLPPDPGSSAVVRIDAVNNRLDEIVDTRNVVGGLPAWFGVGAMAVTPDDKYLVMLDAPGAHQLLLYDIENGLFVDYIDFGDQVELTNLDIRAASE